MLVDHQDSVNLRKRLADLYIHNGDIDQAVMQLDAVAEFSACGKQEHRSSKYA